MSDKLGLEDVEDYRGLYHRAPMLAGVLLVRRPLAFGMPGTGGFMGKLWLLMGTLEDGRWSLLVMMTVNGLISLSVLLEGHPHNLRPYRPQPGAGQGAGGVLGCAGDQRCGNHRYRHLP